jgi:hypothetical protein
MFDTIMASCFYFILSELTQIVTDVISDPTLPRTADHPCK